MLVQEYGITQDDKLLIGQCICAPLLRKILADFQRNEEEEDDTTRLDSRLAAKQVFANIENCCMTFQGIIYKSLTVPLDGKNC